LLKQLSDAGIKKDSADDVISEKEKVDLLNHLRRSHGKTEAPKAAEGAPSKITLKRKTTTELKQPAGTRAPRGATPRPSKTVSVEVRRKRTYVKRGEAEAPKPDEELLKQAEEARKALAEQEAQRKEIEAADEARRKAEEVRRQAEVAEKEAAEEARRKAEEEVRRQAEAAERLKAEEQAAQERARAEAEVQKAQEKPAKKLAKKEKETPRRGEEAAKRGRKELHVSETRRGKRKPAGKAGGRRAAAAAASGEHGFQRPTAPVIKDVEVPESITVGELAQRMSVKASEVIKTLMKMGSMVTINQALDQDTAALVVEEMGHTAVFAKAETVEEAVLAKVEEAHDLGDA
jgi:translation initiation factor IF-2